MAGENQQFNKGKFGKLDSQALNQVIRSAQGSRNDLETSQTPFSRESRTAPGSFPIKARIKNKVSQDGTVVGYSWREANYVEGQWAEQADGRGYKEEEKNYAIPLGVNEEDLVNTSFDGSLVHIEYTNTSDGIRLYFIPTASATTALLQILSAHESQQQNRLVGCGDFSGVRKYEVQRMKIDPTYEGGVSGGPTDNPSYVPTEDDPNVRVERYAFNVLETGGGTDLGGITILNHECEITESTAKIPVNTLVIGTLVGLYQTEPKGEGDAQGVADEGGTRVEIYAFTVANDKCFQCCADNLLRKTSNQNRVSLHAESRRRSYSPLSIFDEMIR